MASPAVVDLEHPMKGPGVRPTDAASVALVDAVTSPASVDDTLDAFVDAMASVGIPVVGDDGKPLADVSGPASAAALMGWQARDVALQARSGSGTLGALLDEVAPQAADMPALSAVLAAWLATADTPSGRLGRAFMAGQDVSEPEDLVIPGVVMTLFVDDLTEGTALDAGTSPAPIAQVALAVRGPSVQEAGGVSDQLAELCTRASSFIDNVLRAAFDALKLVAPKSGVGRVIVGIWNWLVDQGKAFVKAVIDSITEPVRVFMRMAVGTVAMISAIVASFAPYASHIEARRTSGIVDTIELPIAPKKAIEGSFDARVDTGDLPDWPSEVRACVGAVSGVELPSLRPVGSEVRWSTSDDGLLVFQTPELVLDEDATARYPFVSTVQPREAKDGVAVQTTVVVRAEVIRRGAREQLGKVIASMLGQLSGPLRAVITQALGGQIAAVQERLARLFDFTTTGRLLVIHRTPKATPPPTEPTEAGLVVRQRFVNRFWNDVMMEVDLLSCDGGDDWSGTFRYTTGPASWETDSTVPMAFAFGDKDRTRASMTVTMVHDSKDHSYIERVPSTLTLTVSRKRSAAGETRTLTFRGNKDDKGPYGYTHLSEPIKVQDAASGACAGA